MTDSAQADHAAPDRPSRRALLGAGVVGAALAVSGARSVAAGSSGFSDDDLSLAGAAISAELAARDLYVVAIEAGADHEIWDLLKKQHEAYAQQIAGITGISANTRSDDLFDANSSTFDTNDPAEPAALLENVAAATHIELLASISDSNLAAAIASIAAMESRHAVVAAGMAGNGDDLDALFTNSASPATLEASS